MRFLSLFITILIIGNVYAQVPTRSYYQDKKLTPREHNLDYKHMKLEVDFEPKKGVVNGEVTHSFVVLQKQVDSTYIDGIDIEIKSIDLDGKEVKYKSDGKGFTIFFSEKLRWNTQHNLHIHYTCKPKKGIYFIGWNDPKNLSQKQIWTQGQGIDNRNWIPFYDEMNDKITSEIIVDFDSKYKVLSNGKKLLEKPNKKTGKTRWHYKMNNPHAPYLVMLGIGNYNIKTVTSNSGVTIDLWYYPAHKDRVESTYKYSAEMMDFFEQEIGVDYAWDKHYSQIPVQDFMYGAMENTTATVFGDFFMVDERAYLDRNYVAVNAHELAHQWFGDLVTARCGAHHWLQESFATYYNYLYEKEVFGQDHYDWNRRNARNAALNATKSDYMPIAHFSAGSTRHYPKGAHVLHMLKYVVGKEQYNAAIKHYLQKHKFGNVDSEDLLIAFHEKLGLSLNWFWEQWVYKGGEPSYNLSFNQISENGKKYGVFNVEQTHETNDIVGLFNMPIVFEIHYKNGTKSAKKVVIKNKNQLVKIPLDKENEVAYALFDPNSNILKNYSFNKSFNMLKEQLLKAEYMIDRYDALVELRNYSFDEKRDILITAFNRENEFHSVKSEIIAQLIDDSNEKSTGLIKQALSDKDVNVRKAVVNHTALIDATLEKNYKALLTDKSYQVIENTLNLLCFNFPENKSEYLDITKNEVGAIGKNVRIEWLRQKGDESAVEELIDYTSVSYEFRTRIAAAQALKYLNKFNSTLLENLCDGAISSNGRLAAPMRDVIKHFYNQASYTKLIYNYINNNERSEVKNKLAKIIN